MNEAEIDGLVSDLQWSFGRRRRELDARLTRLSEEDPEAFGRFLEALTSRLRHKNRADTVRYGALWCLAIVAGVVPALATGIMEFAGIAFLWPLAVYGVERLRLDGVRSSLGKIPDVRVIRVVLWLYYSGENPESHRMLRDLLTVLLPRLSREDAGLISVRYRQALRRDLQGAARRLFPPPSEHVIALMKGLVQIGDRETVPILEDLATRAANRAVRHLAEEGITELTGRFYTGVKSKGAAASRSGRTRPARSRLRGRRG